MIGSEAGERTSTRRKWTAIGVATALLTGAFWLVLLAFNLWLGDTTVEEIRAGAEVPFTRAVGAALGGGLLLMLAGFTALALVSRRVRPARAVAVAGVLGAAMWLWLPFVTGEPYTPMVAGFGAGGLVALRMEPEHTVGRRVLAAVLVTVYLFVLLRIALLIGVIVAPLLPLPALAWADAMAERRALNRPVGETKPPVRRRPRP
ncbi:MAG: hypothetical protein FJW79_01490 [Actinobacteria bacterium]|nr:hypothetical protein [Actinomycetota bacterium]